MYGIITVLGVLQRSRQGYSRRSLEKTRRDISDWHALAIEREVSAKNVLALDLLEKVSEPYVHRLVAVRLTYVSTAPVFGL